MPQPGKRKQRSSACYNQKGKWSKADDAKLIKLVELLGVGQWSEIAQKMPGRIGKQCRERWQNHLQPGIRLEPWTLEEEEQLVVAHRVHGNKWSNIAQIIPGRPENHIKNYWNATLRRKDPLRPDGSASRLKRYMIEECGIETPGSTLPADGTAADAQQEYEAGASKRRRSKRVVEGVNDDDDDDDNDDFDEEESGSSSCSKRHQKLHPSVQTCRSSDSNNTAQHKLGLITPHKPSQFLALSPFACNPSNSTSLHQTADLASFSPLAPAPQPWSASEAGRDSPFGGANTPVPQDLALMFPSMDSPDGRAGTPLPWDLSPALFAIDQPTTGGHLSQATLDIASAFLDDDFDAEPWLAPSFPPPTIAPPPKDFFSQGNAFELPHFVDPVIPQQAPQQAPQHYQSMQQNPTPYPPMQQHPYQPMHPSQHLTSSAGLSHQQVPMYSSSLSSATDCSAAPPQYAAIKSQQWVAPYAMPMSCYMSGPHSGYQQPQQQQQRPQQLQPQQQYGCMPTAVSPFMMAPGQTVQADWMAMLH